MWDLRSKACIATKFPGSSCNDLVCIDETTIVSGHFVSQKSILVIFLKNNRFQKKDKKIRLWDLRAGSEPTQDLELGGKVTSVDVSKNGVHLLACCRDDTLRLIDAKSGRLRRTFAVEGFQVGCDWTRATFTPDSEYISVGKKLLLAKRSGA